MLANELVSASPTYPPQFTISSKTNTVKETQRLTIKNQPNLWYQTLPTKRNNEKHKPQISTDESNTSYHQIFGTLFSLMNVSQRNLFYVAIFLTMCCAGLRLTLLIFMCAIIDLLANGYDGVLTALCPESMFILDQIDCKSAKVLIHVFVVITILLCIISALIHYIQSFIGSTISCSFLTTLNSTVFNKIISQNLSFFDSRDTKDLRCLLARDMKHVRFSIIKLISMCEYLMHFMVGLLYIFIINWDIALMIVTSFIFLIVASVFYSMKHAESAHKRKVAFNLVMIGIQEMLSYISTVKVFSKEEDESFIHKQCVTRAFRYQKHNDKYLFVYQFWMKIIWYFATLSIVWYGSYLLLDTDKEITLGILVIDLFLFLELNACIYQLVTLAPVVIVLGAESLDRINYVLNMEEKKKSNFIPVKEDIDGLIEFENVDYKYPNSDKLVLRNVHLRFEASSTTALVGVSGSGKSTIFKLMMRLIDCDGLKGSISLDNVDLNKYNTGFLHSRIGYVGQNIHLFKNRSIGDNIKFGLKLDIKHHRQFDAECFDEEALYFWRQFKSISDQDVKNAARIANIHTYIMNLPQKYDTIIGGRRGVQLSAGEMQRIAIARAVLMNPRIFLLDEAMSNIDPISKQLIKEALDKIMVNRCVVVIAHRLKTVMNANMIYVLDKGQIVEYGKHEQLLKIDNGKYAQFVEKQRFL